MLQVRKWVAVGIALFGCAILTAALIIEPAGEIHASVVGVFVTCLTYSATLLGLKMPDNAN